MMIFITTQDFLFLGRVLALALFTLTSCSPKPTPFRDPFAVTRGIEAATATEMRNALVVDSDFHPVAGARYEAWQFGETGGLVANLGRIRKDSGMTDSSGGLGIPLHPKTHVIEIVLFVEGEWGTSALTGVQLKPDRSIPGPFVIPSQYELKGNVVASPSGLSEPRRMWVWPATNSYSFPLLEQLSGDSYLNGYWDPPDPLPETEDVKSLRRIGGHPHNLPLAKEVKLAKDGGFVTTGRGDHMMICVLDREGRYHSEIVESSEADAVKLELVDSRQAVIKVVDEYGRPAVGAEVVSAGGGQCGLFQVMDRCGFVPKSGELNATGNFGEFMTVSARWRSTDPWYTYDVINHEGKALTPIYPCVLPQPMSVQCSFENIPEGKKLTQAILVSPDYFGDPTGPAWHAKAELDEAGEFSIPRVPPMSSLCVLLEVNGSEWVEFSSWWDAGWSEVVFDWEDRNK
jgi:hypothetical protein